MDTFGKLESVSSVDFFDPYANLPAPLNFQWNGIDVPSPSPSPSPSSSQYTFSPYSGMGPSPHPVGPFPKVKRAGKVEHADNRQSEDVMVMVPHTGVSPTMACLDISKEPSPFVMDNTTGSSTTKRIRRNSCCGEEHRGYCNKLHKPDSSSNQEPNSTEVAIEVGGVWGW